MAVVRLLHWAFFLVSRHLIILETTPRIFQRFGPNDTVSLTRHDWTPQPAPEITHSY